MVGVAHGASRHVTVVELQPGTLLCLCTDGLIERKEYSLDDGLARLCKSVAAQSAEAACAGVMGTLVGNEPVRDDIALLVFRRLPAVVS